MHLRSRAFIMITAAALASSLLGGPTKVSADTQYYGDIQGKTYLSNYFDGYSHGVWGSTWVTSGAYVYTIREELHPQWYCLQDLPWCPGFLPGWNSASTQVVDQYANYVSTSYYNGTHAARGWSWHKDWFSGDQGTTSDGY